MKSPTMSGVDLPAILEQALVDGCPTPLRQALADALGGGAKPRHLLLIVRRLTGGPYSPRDGLLYLCAEAFLERRNGGPL